MGAKPNNENEIKNSIGNIYQEMAHRRAEERVKRQEEKELKKLEKAEEKEIRKANKKSRKERLLDSENAYKSIIFDITGEDIDYVAPKKKRNFKKWVDDEDELMVKKPKKKKKTDYRKQFAPELSMLKSLVADQNKFTTDLLKRFNTLAKDGQMNKTIVDLIANINSSRNNALGMLREIGNIKKYISELYWKQRKQEWDELKAGAGGSKLSEEEGNQIVTGASIFESMFGNQQIDFDTNPFNDPNSPTQLVPAPDITVPGIQPQSEVSNTFTPAQDFDPSTWNRSDLITPHTKYENIPHEVIVEWDKDNDRARFKAVRTDTGEELPDYPIPQIDYSKLTFDTDNMVVKGEFEDSYKLIIL